jgi:hypothetical protein
VIRGRELPRIRQEDRDDFSWLQPRSDKASCELLNDVSIFPVRKSAVRGGIDQCDFLWEFSAGIQYDVVQKKAGRVGVKLGAQHGLTDCSEVSGKSEVGRLGLS